LVLLALSLALAIPRTLVPFTFNDVKTPQARNNHILIQVAFDGADSVRTTGLASYGNRMGLERFVLPYGKPVVLRDIAASCATKDGLNLTTTRPPRPLAPNPSQLTDNPPGSTRAPISLRPPLCLPDSSSPARSCSPRSAAGGGGCPDSLSDGRGRTSWLAGSICDGIAGWDHPCQRGHHEEYVTFYRTDPF
jgi:hypothetical protein